MTVIADLEIRVRTILRDLDDAGAVPTDPRWATLSIQTWLAEGEEEICRRAYVIEDATTVAICKLTMATGIASYTLSSKIILIEDAMLYTSTGVFVSHINIINKKVATEQKSSWNTDTGIPTDIIITGKDTVLVTPIPTILENGYYIMLNVKRLPVTVLSSTNTTPEISAAYYTDMCYWACHKAYLQDDTDTLDLKQSQAFYNMFASSIGIRPDAYTETVIRQQPRTGLKIQVKR